MIFGRKPVVHEPSMFPMLFSFSAVGFSYAAGRVADESGRFALLLAIAAAMAYLAVKLARADGRRDIR